MVLPTKPSTSPAPTATQTAPAKVATPAAAPTVAASNDSGEKVAIKQFGPARNGDLIIPAPTPSGVDLVALEKSLFDTVSAFLAAAGVTNVEEFAATLAGIDKTQYPGHKEGRVSYATSNIVQNVFKMHGLLNKVRGASGGAVMKKKIEEQAKELADLKAQLAALMAQVK